MSKVKVLSNKECVIVIAGVRITPEVNTLEDWQFDAVKTHPDFIYLKKDGSFVLLDSDEEKEVVAEVKPLEKMTIAELKEKASELGLNVAEATKNEIIEAIKAVK